MSSLGDPRSQASVADFLGQMRQKGVRFWMEEGRLRYKGVKGALTPEDVSVLKSNREQIIQLLTKPAESAGPHGTHPGHAATCAPLAYSQLAHWNLYGLAERTSYRQLATAARLRGCIDVQVLRKSLAALVRAQPALRTRVFATGGVPVQSVLETAEVGMSSIDLSGLAGSNREREIRRILNEMILEPVDPASDSLVSVALLRLGANEYALLFSMEHMISDAFSMGIFLRSLLAGYAQLIRGEPLSLPQVDVSFADYAIWQMGTEATWLSRHGRYWTERLAGASRVRFPSSGRRPGHESGWSWASIHVQRSLKAQLQECCRLQQTTPAMAAFACYVALVCRWCGVSDLVVQYETSGREDPRVANTIGYFASAICLRVRCEPQDTFAHLIKRVTEEYCSAHHHADAAYYESREPRPEVYRNTYFNWVPQSAPIDLSSLNGTPYALEVELLPFDNPVLERIHRDNEPIMLLFDEGLQVTGGVFYPVERFSPLEMERLARNYKTFLQALAESPGSKVNRVELVD